MKKKLFVFLIGIIALGALSGCHFFWKGYHDRFNDYSLTVPRGWEIDTHRPPAALIVLSPREGKNDKFRENLTVTLADLPDDEAKEVFWDTNKKIILTSLPGYKSQIKEGEMYAGFDRGQWLKFNLISKDIKITVKTVAWFKGFRVYSLTVTAETSKYHRYEKTFEKMLSSFSSSYVPPRVQSLSKPAQNVER